MASARTMRIAQQPRCSLPLLLSLVLLLALLPCCLSDMTAAPLFDQSGRLPPIGSGLGGSFVARGLWAPSSAVWYPGSRSSLRPRDLHPFVQLKVQIWTGSDIRTVNVRFESLLPRRALLTWLPYATPRGQAPPPRESLELLPGEVSHCFYISTKYSSAGGPGTTWFDLRLALWDDSRAQWSTRANESVVWTWPPRPLVLPSPSPLADPDFHTDWITVQLKMTSPKPSPANTIQWKPTPRSEMFQIVLADRRQHFNGTAMDPATGGGSASVLVRPASDLMFVNCTGEGQFQSGYGCWIGPAMLDPDRVPSSDLDHPEGLGLLLAQFYVYELRRFDTFKHIANTSRKPDRFEYMSLGSRMDLYPALPRLPLQFLPLFGSQLYDPCPFEVANRGVGQGDPSVPGAQPPSDVCDPSASSSNCATMYAHSGVRVLGLWSTVPGDIYLCRFDGQSPSGGGTGAGGGGGGGSAIVHVLGSVAVSGQSLLCGLDLEAWGSFRAGWVLSLTLVTFFPANRAFLSPAQELEVARDIQYDQARRLREAHGDPAAMRDRPVALPMAAAHQQEHQTPPGFVAAAIASMTRLASTLTSAFSSPPPLTKLSAATSAAATSRLSDVQRAHHADHWRDIEQMLQPGWTPPSPSPSSSRRHRRLFQSPAAASDGSSTPVLNASNPWNDLPYAGGSTPSNSTVLQYLAEFVVPYGGYPLFPSSSAGARTPSFIVASQPVPDLPDLLEARANTFVWAVSTNAGLATLSMIIAAFTVIILCAAKDKYGHMCCKPQQQRRPQQQQQQRRQVPPRNDGVVAVRLMDVEPLPARSSSASAAAASSDPADDSAWTFDFAHEALIDRQVAVSVQRMEQKDHHDDDSHAHGPSQDAKRALKSSGANRALGASLLHTSSSSAAIPHAEDVALSSYRAPSSSALMPPAADDVSAYASL